MLELIPIVCFIVLTISMAVSLGMLAHDYVKGVESKKKGIELKYLISGGIMFFSGVVFGGFSESTMPIRLVLIAISLVVSVLTAVIVLKLYQPKPA